MSSGELIVVYFEAGFDQWKSFSFPPDLFISVFQNSSFETLGFYIHLRWS